MKHLEDFESLVFETQSEPEVAQHALKEFSDHILANSSRKVPISELLLGLNAIFDSYKPAPGSPLSSEFRIALDRIERYMIVQMTSSVPPNVLSNATYYFCKFQAGSDNLWSTFES